MRRWLLRIRGALGMGLIWGVAGFGFGIVIEVIHNVWPNPVGSAVDIWPAVLGYPAFLGGVAFSVVLGVAGRRRRFDELSVPVVAAWGALGGVLVSLVPAAMVAMGLATPNVPIWEITLGILGPLTLGGAAAASVSLMLAQRAGDDQGVGRDGPALGPTETDGRELPGAGR